MSAKVLPFPPRYPRDVEGVSLYRSGKTWTLRWSRNGRIVEAYGLSIDDVRDLHESAAVVIEAFGP